VLILHQQQLILEAFLLFRVGRISVLKRVWNWSFLSAAMSNRTLRAICPLLVFPLVLCIVGISITPWDFTGPLRAGKSPQPGERRSLQMLALIAVSFRV